MHTERESQSASLHHVAAWSGRSTAELPFENATSMIRRVIAEEQTLIDRVMCERENPSSLRDGTENDCLKVARNDFTMTPRRLVPRGRGRNAMHFQTNNTVHIGAEMLFSKEINAVEKLIVQCSSLLRVG